MMKNKRIWMGVAAGSGLGIAWLFHRRTAKTAALASFNRFFERTYGPEKAGHLSQSMRRRYEALLSERPMPEDRKTRNHLEKIILPGLAFYQVLLQVYGGDQAAALAKTDEAFRDWTLERFQRPLAPMKVLPTPFSMFKAAFLLRLKAFPDELASQVIEDSPNRFVLRSTQCFYLDYLKIFGAPELTPSFCKTDEVMAELFPAEVRFIREHTLARGDEYCDFQYVYEK